MPKKKKGGGKKKGKRYLILFSSVESDLSFCFNFYSKKAPKDSSAGLKDFVSIYIYYNIIRI